MMRCFVQTSQLPQRSIEDIAHAPQLIAASKRLSKVDNAKALTALVRQWLIIIAAVSLSISVHSWLVYALSILVIASRQHALGVLFHDACHYRLLSSRRANDWVGDLFCALPGGISLARYRYEHLRHHQSPNTDEDPYWKVFQLNPRNWLWPKTPLSAAIVFGKDITGLNTPKTLDEFSSWFPWRNHFGEADYPLPLSWSDRARVYIFFASLIVVLSVFHGWYYFFLLWILPLSTAFQALFHLRSIAEHFALPDEAGTDATRHVDASAIEILVGICPLNVNCHLAHHLFPSIPQYNLQEMTDVLFSNAEFAARAHRSPSYLGRQGVLFRELLSDRRRPSEAPS